MAVVVAPFAIVAFWGSSYLLDCIRTLESPGVPIELSVHTDAGDLTVSAASYSISPMRGAVYLTRPKLAGPLGLVLAQLDTLEITGIKLLEGGNQALRIRGSNLTGRVERRKDGKFDFEDFIPKQAGSGGQVSFDVDINRAQVVFVDQGGNAPWSTTVDSPRVAVAGVGQDWVASGRFNASGVGAVDLDIHNSGKDGVTIGGSTDSAQLASVGTHLLESPLLAKLGSFRKATAESLVASGPFQARIPRTSSPTIQAKVSITAIGLKWEKFSAQQAQFQGEISAVGAKGEVSLIEGKTNASFIGSTHWQHQLTVAGQSTISVPSSADIPTWARAFLPAGSQFQNGVFNGWLSYRSAQTYHVSGQVTASEAGHDKLVIGGIRANVEAESRRVVVDLLEGQLSEKPISGIFEIDPLQKTIKGSVTAARIDLANLGSQFGFHQVAGDAAMAARFSGTTLKPIVEFQTSGQGIANLPKDHTISLGHFELGGTYDNGSTTLSRAYFNTPEGVVWGKGTLHQSGQINAEVTGRGILAAAYDPLFSGSINLNANLVGTLKRPKVKGRIEGYDLTYRTKSVPAIVADFKADHSQIELDNIEAARGTATLSGSGNIQLRDRNLHASLSAHDIQLAEWLGDAFVGSVDIPQIDIAGTLEHPLATAKFEGASLVVNGVKVDKISASLSATEKSLLLNQALLNGADGTASVLGSYDLEHGFGSVQVTANDISVSRVLPSFTDAVYASGTVNCVATVTVKGGKITDANASGTLKSVSVNGTAFGDGSWDLNSANSIYHGQLKLGDDSRFVRLTNGVYDPDLNRFVGDFATKNIQATNFLDSSSRYLANLSADTRDIIDSFDGSITLSSHVEGNLSNPNVKMNLLEVSNLSFRKVPLGQFDSSFELQNHKWNVLSANLSKGPATVSVHGTIDEQGEMHLDGTRDNKFDLGQLSALDARVSRMTGSADLWFTADGPVKSPKIVASLNFDNLFAPPGVALGEEHDDRYLRVNFDHIVLDPSSSGGSGAEISGVYFYKGFQGSITAKAPFNLPFEIPENQPLSASVSFDQSDLKDIAKLLGGIDSSRTSGTAKGELNLSGTKDAVDLNGGVSLKAESLALNGVDDIFRNATGEIGIKKDALNVSINGDPIRGGSIAAALKVPFKSLQDLADSIQKGGFSSVLDRPISGEFTTKSAQLRQRVMGQSSIAGTADALVTVAGTIRRPVLSGSVAIGAADIVIKAVPEPDKVPEEFTIDPEFNVDFRLSDPGRLRSSTADMYLSGGGKLTGRIQRPKASAALVVERGTVRLPASLLRLEQGGTVDFTYGVSGPGTATAVVDMEGSTSVTATRFVDTDVQRYDITLGFKGDLLQADGLTLTATSDPGDLSQDRILAILGQADLLQTLSAGGKESSAIQTAMLSTVPMLLDPYTGQVARGLGLDFLNVEYNSYDLASIAFGKVLGSGFSIEGSRQLSEPPPGFQLRYDYRLIYRPKRLFGALSRVRFYVGSDQDRRWKLGLEYGIRF